MDRPVRQPDHRGMNELLLLIVPAIFLAAGLVKGLSGMGLPTLSMALLGLFMPLHGAAALMVLPSLITNVAQCLGPHWRSLLHRLWPLWLGFTLAALLGWMPPPGSDPRANRLLMGLVLLGYGGWGLMKPQLPQLGRHERWTGLAAGLLSGQLTLLTGVFVMPLAPWLQALRLARPAQLQAMGLSFTLATLLLAWRLGAGLEPAGGGWGALLDGRGGALRLATALAPQALALAAALLGMWAGMRLAGRLSTAAFQRVVYGVFVALGGLMLWRAL